VESRPAPGSLALARDDKPVENAWAASEREAGARARKDALSVPGVPRVPALDGSRQVRPGEELDAERLAAWLAENLPAVPEPAPEAQTPEAFPPDHPHTRLPSAAPGPFPGLEIEQFPGGHSNLTYLLRWNGRELVLRRPPFGTEVATAHDMGREYRVLSHLAGRYPKAPRALAACEDPSVLGAPFYVMERVRGVILRGSTLPPGVELPPERMRRLSEALVDGLAELHAVDVEAAGLAGLGKPAGYAERQVAGWSERWRRAKTDDVPDLDRAAAWLAGNLPTEDSAPREGSAPRAALIHNDYKYDNLVLDPADPTRVRAVLDWEMATVGDPLMDLGTTLGYWSDPGEDPALRALPVGPTSLPGNLTRGEVVERYARASGRPVEAPLFYYVYGLFKIAVIAQQIYFRYARGLTRDERFAGLLPVVQTLGRTAARALDKGRIDRLWE
jgi:aminoglycoside phosphotransferase (APT) family kinase protein